MEPRERRQRRIEKDERVTPNPTPHAKGGIIPGSGCMGSMAPHTHALFDLPTGAALP